MTKFERKVEITDTVEVVELDRCLAVDYDVKSLLKNDKFFICKSDFSKWNKKVFDFHNVSKKYLYFNNEFWNLANARGLSYSKLWDLFPDCIVDPMKAITLSDFSEDKVVWFDLNSHLLYNLGAKNPISMPYYKDYISGVTNEYFDLKKAQEILSKNPNVLWINPIQIPYYNASPGKDRAIEFVVRFPQETHDLLCNYFRDEIRDQFWTVRVKECIVWRPWFAENHKDIDLDILGLKSCYVENNGSDSEEEN